MKKVRCDKISIGTAQFGLDYGVTNKNGELSTKQIENIIEIAKGNGISKIDTAPSYGSAEKKLGDVGISGFEITTKLPRLEYRSSSQVYSVIEKCVTSSLKKLKIDVIENLLCHDVDAFSSTSAGYIYEALALLKEKGIINNIGISVYEVETAKLAIKNFPIDIIQGPHNLFDRSFAEAYELGHLKKSVAFQARSIFLQGLLLREGLPPNFSKWKLGFAKYQAIILDKEYSPLAVCLNDAVRNSNIAEVVIGFGSPDNLIEIINTPEVDPSSIVTKVAEMNFDRQLTDPRLW